MIVLEIKIIILSLWFQKEIESLFKEFGEIASFQYFRSFRRMRVNYNCPTAAAKARIHLHQKQFLNTVINCYFAQVSLSVQNIFSTLKWEKIYTVYPFIEKLSHNVNTPFIIYIMTDYINHKPNVNLNSYVYFLFQPHFA